MKDWIFKSLKLIRPNACKNTDCFDLDLWQKKTNLQNLVPWALFDYFIFESVWSNFLAIHFFILTVLFCYIYLKIVFTLSQPPTSHRTIIFHFLLGFYYTYYNYFNPGFLIWCLGHLRMLYGNSVLCKPRGLLGVNCWCGVIF